MLGTSGARTINNGPFDIGAGMLVTSGTGTTGTGPFDLGAGMSANSGAGTINSGPFSLGDGMQVTSGTGTIGGNVIGTGAIRSSTNSSQDMGEDPLRELTFEELFKIAKSEKHFSVLLVRKLFSREQLEGHSVHGGRNGKLALDAQLLERVKWIFFTFYTLENKEEAWKDCVTAINTYLRGRANRKRKL